MSEPVRKAVAIKSPFAFSMSTPAYRNTCNRSLYRFI
jgi:hypothetical protein